MEYTKVKLGDILTSISETISKEQQTAIFLNTSDISEGKFLHKRSSVVKELPGQAKKKIKNGDILFSEIRPKNKRYAVVDVSNPNDYVVSTKLMVLRIKDPSKYYLQYIYQQLISQKMLHQINEIAESRSGTFPQITFDAIKNIELTPPPLEEQKRIADIFTVLDDKIELNNQMNQTLEEIASLLYKRWFVDFEFPDDKGNPYKSSGGEMVDSELGMIPKGWEVKELGEFITLINGYAFKSGSYSKDGNYKIITIKNVLDNKFITNSTNKILEIPDNVIENQKLKIGDVLISLTGNVGRVCVVTEGECLLNQRVAKIISKIEVNKYYWRTFFNTEEIKIKMINISKGTAQSNLSTIEIMKIKILNSKEVTYNFSEKIKAISKKKLQNEIMILNIEMIKQKLLEELI